MQKENNMDYKVSKKRGEKFWQFGTIKKNQWGNLQLSMKNTKELKELVNSGEEWLNFSLFENDGASKAPKPSKPYDDNSDIPF